MLLESDRRSHIRSLQDTINRLGSLRSRPNGPSAPAGEELPQFGRFGSNPGALRARYHVPEGLAEGAPLVVVLHGCTQTASGYNHNSGWSKLADERGFALLFPEQQRANNPNLCFNWFSRSDASRESGEALSIRQMVAAMQEAHSTDPDRTFVTGLSAGGAMAAVMLATYPEVFAGGAVIAGLPYGVADTVPEAFDLMRGHGIPDGLELTELVREASDYAGPWPTLSVWHGGSDATVDPVNAKALVEQWRKLHGAAEAPAREDMIDGYPHRAWCDSAGRTVIEEYSIPGMSHGTPLSTRQPGSHEVAGAYMLEAGISSTRRTAEFWGIGDKGAQRRPRAVAAKEAKPVERRETPAAAPVSTGVQKTIEDALRSAGLMR